MGASPLISSGQMCLANLHLAESGARALQAEVSMKKRLPRVGMRMVKTSLAIFVCLVISMLLNTPSKGIYMTIAALICIQPDVHSSVKVGLSRLVGTFVGALFGLVTMLAISPWPNMPQLVKILVFSLFILLCIYTNILVRHPDSSVITCVTYLSIVLSTFAQGDILPYAGLRFFETALGVLVAIAINLIPSPGGGEDAERGIEDEACGNGKEPGK